jgi:hypothetical protein
MIKDGNQVSMEWAKIQVTFSFRTSLRPGVNPVVPDSQLKFDVFH